MNNHDRKCLKRKPAVIIVLLTICILTFCKGGYAYATTTDSTAASTTANSGNSVSGTLGPLEFNLNTGENSTGLSSTLQMLMVLTIISLAPSILIMVTSFTRIIIVLHFVRSALGTQTTPPNQVLIGLALFLTFFIMSPVISQINTDAIQPLNEGKITQEQAFDAGVAPIRTFMLKQTEPKDLRLFLDIAKINANSLKSEAEIPITVIIPSFIISELRKAFIIGFIIYIPFIVIDMVVASTLMSMGMMMLPPTMISMPFKILLFIMADGWNLIIGSLVKTFY
ncbi:MAG TPA: flagellar type III secretion system pore protein FliP [Mobilitalea sp.]|nr:flagellar type III secretion system pore protein FliP [Mobilitalea sp.]